MQKLQLIRQNPKLAEGMLQSDPRMIDVLGVLMGIDMQGFQREEGSDELPPGVKEEDVRSESQPAASSSSSPPPKPAASAPQPQEDEDVEMDDEEAKAKKEAQEEKAAGAAAYKARDLSKAEQHFSKAWEVWPQDVTYLTNLSGKPSIKLSALEACSVLRVLQPSTSSKETTTSASRLARRRSRRAARYVNTNALCTTAPLTCI